MRLNIDGAVGTTLEQVRDIYKLTADENRAAFTECRYVGLVWSQYWRDHATTTLTGLNPNNCMYRQSCSESTIQDNVQETTRNCYKTLKRR